MHSDFSEARSSFFMAEVRRGCVVGIAACPAPGRASGGCGIRTPEVGAGAASAGTRDRPAQRPARPHAPFGGRNTHQRPKQALPPRAEGGRSSMEIQNQREATKEVLGSGRAPAIEFFGVFWESGPSRPPSRTGSRRRAANSVAARGVDWAGAPLPARRSPSVTHRAIRSARPQCRGVDCAAPPRPARSLPCLSPGPAAVDVTPTMVRTTRAVVQESNPDPQPAHGPMAQLSLSCFVLLTFVSGPSIFSPAQDTPAHPCRCSLPSVLCRRPFRRSSLSSFLPRE